MRPLAIDLFCGLGGWTEGLLAEGWNVIGFDNERHAYPSRAFALPEEASKGMAGTNRHGTTLINAAREQVHGFHTAPLTGGWDVYPAQLVLQDVLTIHGSQFKDAALIVASPPCQEYSYMAMPWSRAKAIAAEYRSGVRDVKKLTELFDACFRIQREAIEAAGHHIPLVVENVRGAIPWVGRSRWNYGSFHLWGDVPALMPMTKSLKLAGFRFDGSGRSFQSESVDRHAKNTGGSWFNVAHNTTSGKGNNPEGRPIRRINEAHPSKSPEKGYGFVTEDGRKHGGDCFNDPSWPGKQGGTKQPGIGGPRKNGKGDAWFQDGAATHGSKSPARKAASAMIAKIPIALARWIGRAWYPEETALEA